MDIEERFDQHRKSMTEVAAAVVTLAEVIDAKIHVEPEKPVLEISTEVTDDRRHLLLEEEITRLREVIQSAYDIGIASSGDYKPSPQTALELLRLEIEGREV